MPFRRAPNCATGPREATDKVAASPPGINPAARVARAARGPVEHRVSAAGNPGRDEPRSGPAEKASDRGDEKGARDGVDVGLDLAHDGDRAAGRAEEAHLEAVDLARPAVAHT